MIYITAPFIVRTESNQIGANDLKEGELCFVGKRLIIGNSLTGHPNFNREAFPYSNTELLSEAGPKVQSLFSEFLFHIEEQNIALKIPANTNINTGIATREGGFYEPLYIYNDSYSLTIKYAIMTNNNGATALRNGTFRSLGSNGTVTSKSSGPINSAAVDNGSGPEILPLDPFQVYYNEEPSGNYYSVLINNPTDFDMTAVFSYVLVLP